MVFPKNLDHLFKEETGNFFINPRINPAVSHNVQQKKKNLKVKVLEKLKNPKIYLSIIPYFNLWHYNKYSKNKNLGAYLFYGLYTIPPTLKLTWIGIGIFTGIWNPIEQYKTIEKFVKSEKETYQKIGEKEKLDSTNSKLSY